MSQVDNQFIFYCDQDNVPFQNNAYCIIINALMCTNGAAGKCEATFLYYRVV